LPSRTTSLWVVGLSLSVSPPTSVVMEAASAAPLLPPLSLRLRRLRAAKRASSGAALVASATEVTAVSRLLSWGFSKIASPSCSSCVHSWQARVRVAKPKRVPLVPFLTTSAVYSTQGLAGLLHPANDHEVHLVSSRLSTCRAKRDRRTPNYSHRCYALRSVSLSSSGFPVTRALPPRC
jgi:hypothetical protein